MSDELKQLKASCEKVLDLLKANEVGLVSWNRLLVENCQELTEILHSGGAVCPKCELTTPFTSDDNPPRTEKKYE